MYSFNSKNFITKHIRIIDRSDYGLDVEKFIENLEICFKIDFRKIPQSKKLIKSLFNVKTERHLNIQEANIRHNEIIQKLLIEYFRPSPFEPMNMSRERFKRATQSSKQSITALTNKSSERSLADISQMIEKIEIENIMEGNEENDEQEESKKEDQEDKICNEEKIDEPFVVSANPKRLVSLIRWLENIKLVYTGTEKNNAIVMMTSSNRSIRNRTALVVASPQHIVIEHQDHQTSRKPSVVHFKIVNTSKDIVLIRYTERKSKPFNIVSIKPPKNVKAYPGMGVTFSMYYKLAKIDSSVETELLFRVYRNLFENPYEEMLIVPIDIQVQESKPICIPKTIMTDSVSLWNCKNHVLKPKYGILKILVKATSYHVHIRKQIRDNWIENNFDKPVPGYVGDRESKSYTSPKRVNSEISTRNSSASRTEAEFLCQYLYEEVIDVALNTFVFNKSYIYAKPNSTTEVGVYFSKPERVGFHQDRYNIFFFSTSDYELCVTESVLVFGEVIKNLLTMSPKVLDMRLSPVTHGVLRDYFTITNTNTQQSVTVKVILSTRLKNTIVIKPSHCVIPPAGNFQIYISFCSKAIIEGTHKLDDLLHFHLKLKILGKLSLCYDNAPLQFYYNVIAPYTDCNDLTKINE